MEWYYKLERKLLRMQSIYRRQLRIIFPSPAEIRFAELMGAKYAQVLLFRDRRTKFPMAIRIKRGKLFKQERVKREVSIGPYWVDFANDLNRIIEIDGDPYHMDVVADMDREIHITDICSRKKMDARFMRIKAHELYRDPDLVQRKVLKFLLG